MNRNADRKTERKLDRKRNKKKNRPELLGRLLTMLPSSSPLLYPLYLAAQLDTVEETYASPRWPQEFDGLKIAFLSDIHYGFMFKEERVRKLAHRVNALDADILLLGGDYGHDSYGAVEFFQLKPGFQARIAVLGAYGNHDRFQPEKGMAKKIARGMIEDGVIPMMNDAYIIERNGKKIAFASTDDYFRGQPKLKKVARLCGEADFTVYFPHNPDILPKTQEMPGGPFYQLAICGHTHGGQVSFFGHSIKSPSIYGDRFLSGWYHEKGTDILVSNGVGTSWLPVRLGARPQIHLLTMKTKG